MVFGMVNENNFCQYVRIHVTYLHSKNERHNLLSFAENCSKVETIHTTQFFTLNARTKHIDIRFHYIRELVQDGTISLPIEDMMADILTKPLPKVDLKLFVIH